jgi:hypothetical protein
MSDKELVKALRDFADDGYADLSIAAADRIELLATANKQLVATNEALTAENKRLGKQCEGLMQAGMNNGQALIIAEAKLAECEARLGKAVELLKEARQDLEEYVTHEWPKDEHPVYERKWERDMELCRRIDATLAEIEGEKP